MSGPLRLVEMAHASNTGRVREHNEDRYLVRPPLLAVADGMGGAKAGEVAAQITDRDARWPGRRLDAARPSRGDRRGQRPNPRRGR